MSKSEKLLIGFSLAILACLGYGTLAITGSWGFVLSTIALAAVLVTIGRAWGHAEFTRTLDREEQRIKAAESVKSPKETREQVRDRKLYDAVERELQRRMPAWDPPSACADIAEETLEAYRDSCRRRRPGLTPAGIEWMAREQALANLRERAAYRKEISEYTGS